MKLSLKLLLSELEIACDGAAFGDAADRKMDSVRYIRSFSEAGDRNILYIASGVCGHFADSGPNRETASVSGPGRQVFSAENHCIILCPRSLAVPPSCCCAFSVLEEEPFSVFNRVLGLFDKYNAWERSLYEILNRDGTIDELLECSSPIFGNALYVVDSSFKVLAIQDIPEMSEMSYAWRFLVHYRYLPIHLISGMEKNHELAMLEKYTEPVFFHSKMFYNNFISANLVIDQKSQGWLFIVELLSKFKEYYLELAEFLARMVKTAIRRMPSFHLGHGDFYEHFLIDVLSGKLNDRPVIADQLTFWGWSINGLYAMLAIDVREEDYTVVGAIRHEVGLRLKGQSVVYQNLLVVIFFFQNLNDYPDHKTKTGNYLKSIDKVGCITDIFMDFTHIRLLYKQLKTIFQLPFQRTGSHLCEYKEFVLQLLIKDYKAASNIRLICNHAVQGLLSYDQRHRTEYYATLKCYLQNERSLKQTALSLRIHRNTLIKRLEKISCLIYADLDDYATRMWMLLSFQILDLEQAEKEL